MVARPAAQAAVSVEQLAGDVDVFAPGLLGRRHGLAQRLVLAHAGELDQHRQVDAGDHLDALAVHGRDREVRRRAAEHVGEHHDAAAVVDLADRIDDLACAAARCRRRRRCRPRGPCACGPTTCSIAARNSAASRPCVTRTRPIMRAASRRPRRRDPDHGAPWSPPSRNPAASGPSAPPGTPSDACRPCSRTRSSGSSFLRSGSAAAAAAAAPRRSATNGSNAGSARMCSCTAAILAGRRAQRVDIVRIVQEAHVEDQIGLARQAVAGRRTTSP